MLIASWLTLFNPVWITVRVHLGGRNKELHFPRASDERPVSGREEIKKYIILHILDEFWREMRPYGN